MAWTLGQLQRAWNLIPELSTDEVENALRRARKALPAAQKETLRHGLGVALHNYIVERLQEEGRGDVKRSAVARQLDRIAKQAVRLQSLISQGGNAITLAASEEVRRALQQRTHRLRQTLVLPPTDAAGVGALQAISGAVATLAEAATRAFKRERVLIERKVGQQGKARHIGDRAMRTLISSINGTWADVFEEVPGVTPSESHDGGGGAYLPFVHALLRAYADRIPNELQRMAPVRARLRLTQQAIRAHFRATRISRLRRMA